MIRRIENVVGRINVNHITAGFLILIALMVLFYAYFILYVWFDLAYRSNFLPKDISHGLTLLTGHKLFRPVRRKLGFKNF